MNKSRLFLITIITLLVAGNIYFGSMFILEKNKLNEISGQLKNQESSEKALYFANLFIDKVLEGKDVVDFEDRLKLENAVRDIGDKEIFDQWQIFIKSQSDTDTQASAGRILELLFDKVSQ